MIVWSEEALLALTLYQWPGNVRELQKNVYATLLMAKTNIIEIDDLHEKIRENYFLLKKKYKIPEIEDIYEKLIEIANFVLPKAREAIQNNQENWGNIITHGQNDFCEFLKDHPKIESNLISKREDCYTLFKKCFTSNFADSILCRVTNSLKGKPGLSNNPKGNEPYLLINRFFGINYDSFRKKC